MNHKSVFASMLIAAMLMIGLASTASAYYDSAQGRFISRDPIGTIGSEALPLIESSNVPSIPIRSDVEYDNPRIGLSYRDLRNGRFIDRDPIDIYYPDGPNLMQYAISNPLSNVDPLGMKSGDVCSGIIGKQNKIYFTTPPSGDKWGHWWIEMGSESYGWWPKEKVPGTWAAISGVPGEMNARSFGGTATTDPHHGDKAEKEFKTKIKRFGEIEYGPKKGTKCKCATCDDAKACISAYAGTWTGEWKYPGRNCHTFQRKALKNCCLKEE